LDDLYLKTLEFLQEALEAGQDLEIEDADLEALIAALQKEVNAIENSTESEEETTESTKRPNIYKPSVTEPSTTEPSTTEPSTTEPTTEETTETEPEPSYYTVTFKYNGATFATQTVQRNATAEVPMLQPTASGNWNFDFTTPITQDTIIVWNEK